MNKIILSAIILFGSIQLGNTQKMSAWVNAADSAFFQEHNYYKAFKYYEPALLYDTTDLRLWYQKAESARLFNGYLQAEEAYLYVAGHEQGAGFPCALAYAGQMRLNINDYAGAEKHFNNLRMKFPAAAAGGECSAVVTKGLQTIQFVKDHGNTRQDLEIKNLGPVINSPYSDFGALPVGDTLYFTAYKYDLNEKGYNPARYYAKILRSVANGTPERLPDYINLPDTSLHVGHTAFSLDQSRMYYTICEYTNGVNIRCDLYFRDRNKTGGWGPAQAVRAVNVPGKTSTQPSVGWDNELQLEVLYFASDRLGSMGGLDIWKSVIVNGQNQTPTNLGAAINTPDDDATPFFHTPSQRLFFSSTGHEGFGGYDLFSVRKMQEGWTPVENLGAQINTGADEVYYSLDAAGKKAYFSSNRLGSTLFEQVENDEEKLKEACCLDIYAYESPPPCDLIVSTFTNCNGCPDLPRAPLPEVTIELFDVTDPGQEVLIPGGGPGGAGVVTYSAVLVQGRKYQIRASRPGLTGASYELDFTNYRPCAYGPESVELCLECAAPQLEVRVHNRETNEDITDALVRIVDISAGWERDRSQPSSQGVTLCPDGFYNFNQTIPGQVRIDAFSPHEIAFDQTFLVIASKEGFTFDTLTVKISRDDFCEPNCLRIVDLYLLAPPDLPTVYLYFDNAVPRPLNNVYNSELPDKTYLQTLVEYSTKEADYKAQFTSNDARDFLQRSELDQFFNNELNPSKQSMENFADEIKSMLCQGIAVTVEGNGCASPKFNRQEDQRQVRFNVQLRKRRVNSVKQNLENLGLTKENWGDLFEFKQVERDCTQSPRDNSVTLEELQDQKNRKFSVFSIDASVARRVELRARYRDVQ